MVPDGPVCEQSDPTPGSHPEQSHLPVPVTALGSLSGEWIGFVCVQGCAVPPLAQAQPLKHSLQMKVAQELGNHAGSELGLLPVCPADLRVSRAPTSPGGVSRSSMDGTLILLPRVPSSNANTSLGLGGVPAP